MRKVFTLAKRALLLQKSEEVVRKNGDLIVRGGSEKYRIKQMERNEFRTNSAWTEKLC